MQKKNLSLVVCGSHKETYRTKFLIKLRFNGLKTKSYHVTLKPDCMA